MTKTKEGTCKLTRLHGRFVDAHIIPKALTKPSEQGAPFIQSDGLERPARRWSSWYDSKLVIEEGEKILADYDTWAVSELRKHKLVWSGFGPVLSIPGVQPIVGVPHWGIREITGIDPGRFRLFFLSLLWRAAASDRREFARIVLPREQLEQLRRMVLNRDPQPLSFYPVELVQISTMGPAHNHTPITSMRTTPAFDGQPERQDLIVRFYFDGLAVHFRVQEKDDDPHPRSPMEVGAGSRLVVPAVEFEGSAQKTMLETIIRDTSQNWPVELARLYR